MSTLSLWLGASVPGIDSEVTGSLTRPFTVTGLTLVHKSRFSLATATNKVLLNIGSGSTDDLVDFDLLYILSTQDLSIELIGSVTANNSNFKIKSNIPFLLPFSKTRVYNAAGNFAGALEDLTKITARNDSGTTATIDVRAWT